MSSSEERKNTHQPRRCSSLSRVSLTQVHIVIVLEWVCSSSSGGSVDGRGKWLVLVLSADSSV